MKFPEVIQKVEFSGVLVLGLKICKRCDFCGVSRNENKQIKILGEMLDGSNSSQTPYFFRNSPLLNGLNPNSGNFDYSGKFSKSRGKKRLIRRKKKILSKIADPGPTS